MVVRDTLLKEFPEENVSTEEKDKLVELAKSTENEIYENIAVLLKIVGTDSTYAKRIKKKYKDLYWNVTSNLLNNNRKAICIPFIKKIYEFCDDNDQRILRNTYGYEQLGLSENDLSPGELNDLAIELENAGQKTRAISLLQKAAELGNSFAQSNLAFRYKQGDGVARNINTAIFWWKKSANSGNAIAQFALSHNSYEASENDANRQYYYDEMNSKNFEVITNSFEFLGNFYLGVLHNSYDYTDAQKAEYWKTQAQNAIRSQNVGDLRQAVFELLGLRANSANGSINSVMADLKI